MAFAEWELPDGRTWVSTWPTCGSGHRAASKPPPKQTVVSDYMIYRTVEGEYRFKALVRLYCTFCDTLSTIRQINCPVVKRIHLGCSKCGMEAVQTINISNA